MNKILEKYTNKKNKSNKENFELRSEVKNKVSSSQNPVGKRSNSMYVTRSEVENVQSQWLDQFNKRLSGILNRFQSLPARDVATEPTGEIQVKIKKRPLLPPEFKESKLVQRSASTSEISTPSTLGRDPSLKISDLTSSFYPQETDQVVRQFLEWVRGEGIEPDFERNSDGYEKLYIHNKEQVELFDFLKEVRKSLEDLYKKEPSLFDNIKESEPFLSLVEDFSTGDPQIYTFNKRGIIYFCFLQFVEGGFQFKDEINESPVTSEMGKTKPLFEGKAEILAPFPAKLVASTKAYPENPLYKKSPEEIVRQHLKWLQGDKGKQAQEEPIKQEVKEFLNEETYQTYQKLVGEARSLMLAINAMIENKENKEDIQMVTQKLEEFCRLLRSLYEKKSKDQSETDLLKAIGFQWVSFQQIAKMIPASEEGTTAAIALRNTLNELLAIIYPTLEIKSGSNKITFKATKQAPLVDEEMCPGVETNTDGIEIVYDATNIEELVRFHEDILKALEHLFKSEPSLFNSMDNVVMAISSLFLGSSYDAVNIRTKQGVIFFAFLKFIVAHDEFEHYQIQILQNFEGKNLNFHSNFCCFPELAKLLERLNKKFASTTNIKTYASSLKAALIWGIRQSAGTDKEPDASKSFEKEASVRAMNSEAYAQYLIGSIEEASPSIPLIELSKMMQANKNDAGVDARGLEETAKIKKLEEEALKQIEKNESMLATLQKSDEEIEKLKRQLQAITEKKERKATMKEPDMEAGSLGVNSIKKIEVYDTLLSQLNEETKSGSPTGGNNEVKELQEMISSPNEEDQKVIALLNKYHEKNEDLKKRIQSQFNTNETLEKSLKAANETIYKLKTYLMISLATCFCMMAFLVGLYITLLNEGVYIEDREAII